MAWCPLIVLCSDMWRLYMSLLATPICKWIFQPRLQFENPLFTKNVSGQSWVGKKMACARIELRHSSYRIQSTATDQYMTGQICTNFDLTNVTNQIPCPNGLTQHSGPLVVCICWFCPRPNGQNLTTSVRIWSLTLVSLFRGPAGRPRVAEVQFSPVLWPCSEKWNWDWYFAPNWRTGCGSS